MNLNVKDIAQQAALTLVGNTLVAVLLWLAGMDIGFGYLLLVSQCIGMSIFTLRLLLVCAIDQKQFVLALSLLATVLGAIVGLFLATYLGGDGLKNWFMQHPNMALRYLGMSLLISLVFIYYFSNRERVRSLETAMREAELREATQQKQTLAAQLKLLQAQIEPHFLFNTLANLHSLIESNPPQARRLLEQLNDYLRVSLLHTRSDASTLGDECRLLSAYLEIHHLRMGERLQWTINVPAELQTLPLAPMLLQPLVENAIRHGLEPSIQGGSIEITAQQETGKLHITISDTGLGLTGSGGSGVGLANVRERLLALYGDKARFELRNHSPSGVTAELWLPLAP